MALQLARTSAEAHIYMELRPCEACGESRFEPASSVVEVDGDLASRYSGTCPSCGARREFVFRLPDDIPLPIDDDPRFGDERPSELLDAGEWLWLGDVAAGDVPARPDGLDTRERRRARTDLLTAAAALTEVLKFVPPGADAVPPQGLWSSQGRAVYAAEPGRFRRVRLEAARDTYRDLAARFA
ncbi:hypothetical protein [Micromonospora sp. NBC_01813]|uniref:hypothetical protein n=1 Tax=Micromonospora sp. NBC_01813 TaxID=2975988 RepID=UPI002DD8B951|nr:hypothetical protein [Micromonospora sp. NBC_01813]WSA06267.1 hypothetical protein OG958_18240 [Micromonospora sp. NBC_01813]